MKDIAQDYNKRYPWLKYVGMTLTAFLAMFCVFSVFKGFQTPQKRYKPNVSKYIAAQNDYRAMPKYQVLKQSRNTQQIKAQSFYDSHGESLSLMLRKKSTYMMYLPGAKKKLGYVQFIRGRIVLIPKHFVTQIKRWVDNDDMGNEDIVKLVNMANVDVEFDLPVKYILDYKTCSDLGYKDIVSFMAPRTFPDHTDIVDKFVDEGLIKRNRWLPVRIDVCQKDEVTAYLTEAEYLDVRQDVLGPGGEIYDLRQVLVYTAGTQVGDCGAFLCCVDSTVLRGKILGIHVAGDDMGNGFSVIITNQMLKSVLSQYEDQVKIRA